MFTKKDDESSFCTGIRKISG